MGNKLSETLGKGDKYTFINHTTMDICSPLSKGDLEGRVRALPSSLMEKGLADDGPPLRVVDIGCGKGAMLRAIRDRYPNTKAVGVDSNKAMVDEAKIRAQEAGYGSSLDFHHATFEEWLAREGLQQYDLVICIGSSHCAGHTLASAFTVFEKLLLPHGLLWFGDAVWTTNHPPQEYVEFFGGSFDVFPTMETVESAACESRLRERSGVRENVSEDAFDAYEEQTRSNMATYLSRHDESTECDFNYLKERSHVFSSAQRQWRRGNLGFVVTEFFKASYEEEED